MLYVARLMRPVHFAAALVLLTGACTSATPQSAPTEAAAAIVQPSEAPVPHAPRFVASRSRPKPVPKRHVVRHRAPRTSPTGSDWANSRAARAVSWCESKGNNSAVNPSGKYRGKWQFDYMTWRSVGGSGDPAAASEAEQDYRAWLLWKSRGWSPWQCRSAI